MRVMFIALAIAGGLSFAFAATEHFVVEKKPRSKQKMTSLKEHIAQHLTVLIEKSATVIGTINALQADSIGQLRDVAALQEDSLFSRCSRETLSAYEQKLTNMVRELSEMDKQLKEHFTQLKKSLH